MLRISCRRQWSLALLAGVLALGFWTSALRADEPARKAEPRKEQPQDVEDPIDKEVKRALEEMERMMKQLGAPMNGRLQLRGNGNGIGIGRLSPMLAEEARLGAALEKPSEVLADQLNLPRGQGMVLHEVRVDSAAARAGMKTNDILLELNGKPVPSDPQDFARMLEDIKAKTPVNAVVVRKGQKETIKDLTLPEPEPNPGFNRFNRGGIRIQIGGIGGRGIFVPDGGVPNVPGNNSMNIDRRPDGGFTTRYQEGGVGITITGKTADGKTQIDEIEIKDSRETKKYRSVEDVPDDFRDDVKHLIKKTEKDAGTTKKENNP